MLGSAFLATILMRIAFIFTFDKALDSIGPPYLRYFGDTIYKFSSLG
jgi:hypothetical protein